MKVDRKDWGENYYLLSTIQNLKGIISEPKEYDIEDKVDALLEFCDAWIKISGVEEEAEFKLKQDEENGKTKV